MAAWSAFIAAGSSCWLSSHFIRPATGSITAARTGLPARSTSTSWKAALDSTAARRSDRARAASVPLAPPRRAGRGLVGGDGDDPPTQDALECLAHLEQCLDVLLVEPADDHAPGGPLLDEALVRQLSQRLAHRHPGHPEPVRELALDEPVAGAQLARR